MALHNLLTVFSTHNSLDIIWSYVISLMHLRDNKFDSDDSYRVATLFLCSLKLDLLDPSKI